jgi:P-type Ca2+ transporter type 2C
MRNAGSDGTDDLQKVFTLPYTQQVKILQKTLQTDLKTGLAQFEAEKRVSRYGENRLPEPETTSLLKLFLKQFANFMIYILLGAVALSLFLRDFKDAVLIGIVVVVNAFIGFFQEYKAEKTLASLKKMATPTAKVMRDGQIEEIATERIVIGDIVILEEGDIIPADIRLIESVGLEISESVLTGESVPSAKDADVEIKNKVTLGDQLNMAFMGTVISSGNGSGIVVATGEYTQMGKIAKTLAIPYEKPTPLQKNLDTLGKYLILAAAVVSIIIFILGFLQGRKIDELLFTVISLAVAVIPEGLAAVVTITMAIGVQRMAKRKAIVRNLPSVETLGAVNIICSDKTGTLTEGKMVATDLWVGNKLYTVSGTGVRPEGSIYCDDEPVVNLNEDLKLIITAIALCNDAILQQDESGLWEGVGDPTEIALQVLAHKLQFKKEVLEKKWKFIEGLPFDSNRKRMSVIYNDTLKKIVFAKGAPEEILSVSSHVLENGLKRKLSQIERNHFKKIHLDMAQRGLRVLGVAFREATKLTKDIEPETIEKDLIFLGMVGVLDPPRPEARQAVLECKNAGIRVMMVTGDHPATAQNIASQLGIFQPGHDRLMTGHEMDTISVEKLRSIKPFPVIFARVSPENKLMLVNTLREMKHVVAMTGDGVNDAPAIKHANVGVAMGREGTDVTKQAADIVLADDNFATIVAAVEQGRQIFGNIQKFVRYLLSCNMSTVFSLLFATASGVPLPFTPIQILWLNLVTDTPPALALGFDKREDDAMNKPPRDTKQGIFRKRDVIFILYHAAVMASLMLSVFLIQVYLEGEPIEKARTMAFAMLVLLQLTQSFNARSTKFSIFNKSFFDNKVLLIGVFLSFMLLVGGIYLPFLSGIFEQVKLTLHDWIELAIGVTIFIVFAELFKLRAKKY